MKLSYDQIYQDAKSIIRKYETVNPREILQSRGVKLIAFTENTKLLGMYKIIKRNRFVFFNPFINENLLKSVFSHELGHDLYHRNQAKTGEIIEYELFNIKDSMETQANIFACHLLIDDDEIKKELIKGRSYDELAMIFKVNVNLIIFKLNELYRMGKLEKFPDQPNRNFFSKIDGRNPDNFEI